MACAVMAGTNRDIYAIALYHTKQSLASISTATLTWRRFNIQNGFYLPPQNPSALTFMCLIEMSKTPLCLHGLSFSSLSSVFY